MQDVESIYFFPLNSDHSLVVSSLLPFGPSPGRTFSGSHLLNFPPSHLLNFLSSAVPEFHAPSLHRKRPALSLPVNPSPEKTTHRHLSNMAPNRSSTF